MLPGTLEKVVIEGFKSIGSQTIELRPLNLLIGANGSGKSNFIQFFEFLDALYNQQLNLYVRTHGTANAFLHFGLKVTNVLVIGLSFEGEREGAANDYVCRLVPTREQGFLFEVEWVGYRQKSDQKKGVHLGEGHAESKLKDSNRAIALYVGRFFSGLRVYHFHDTSDTAMVKQSASIHDNEFLRPDASNLAAYLFRLHETNRNCYNTIVETVRLVAPFFRDFNLHPDGLNPKMIRLEWLEQGSDEFFDAYSLSDGTLRFMGLATLLLQPQENKPSVILIDEPELGLHPAAIHILAGLLRSASTESQLIVSTQSVTLINQFEPQDILVVERGVRKARNTHNRGESTLRSESVFRRLSEDRIASWLDDYSLGELWEKNLLGGRPHS